MNYISGFMNIYLELCPMCHSLGLGSVGWWFTLLLILWWFLKKTQENIIKKYSEFNIFMIIQNTKRLIYVFKAVSPPKVNNKSLKHCFLQNDVGGQFFFISALLLLMMYLGNFQKYPTFSISNNHLMHQKSTTQPKTKNVLTGSQIKPPNDNVHIDNVHRC